MTRNPAIASKAEGALTSPKVTRVSGEPAMMPAFFKAMMPRKSPIPAEIAIFKDGGIVSTTHSRRRKRLKIRNKIPEISTAPSATSQE
jgi:hypothetical protein